MKVALCIRALQYDGVSHTAMLLGEVLNDAGHAVSILSSFPDVPDRNILRPGLRYRHIGQRGWESEVGWIKRMGGLFGEECFDVVFILSGLPIPHFEQVLPLIPDRTAIVPIILGDREHVYDPIARTASLWNIGMSISPRLQDEARRRISGKPFRLITHAIEIPSPEELAERAGHSQPLKLIYIGRLFGRKNVWMLPLILSESLRMGSECTLTIVGSGPERQSLENEFKVNGIAHLVTFKNVPTQEQLYELLREHHVLLLPSSPGEGLGLVLLEAQANGCVPVASRISGVTDYAIAEGRSGLLAACTDPKSFAEQICLLREEILWSDMSRAGIQRMRQHFGTVVMTAEIEALLGEIMNGEHVSNVSRSHAPSSKPRLISFLPRSFKTLLDLARRKMAFQMARHLGTKSR